MDTNKHEFYLTGMDRMNMIRKYPAYPVNPVKNNLETLKWEKCIG